MNLQEMIDELTSPLNTDEAVEELKKQFSQIPIVGDDNELLTPEVERLKQQIAGLKRYAQHDNACMHIGDTRYNCTCGLDEILKKH